MKPRRVSLKLEGSEMKFILKFALAILIYSIVSVVVNMVTGLEITGSFLARCLDQIMAMGFGGLITQMAIKEYDI